MAEKIEIKGKAYVIDRDDVDTDMIIPAKYLTTDDAEELGKHAMEFLDRDFSRKITEGGYSILVAGDNFGCGSSREHAVWCLKVLGIKAIIAAGFSRIYFRNSVNNGMLPVRLKEKSIETGDELLLRKDEVINLTKGKEYKTPALPDFAGSIISGGGLISRIKRQIQQQG